MSFQYSGSPRYSRSSQQSRSSVADGDQILIGLLCPCFFIFQDCDKCCDQCCGEGESSTDSGSSVEPLTMDRDDPPEYPPRKRSSQDAQQQQQQQIRSTLRRRSTRIQAQNSSF